MRQTIKRVLSLVALMSTAAYASQAVTPYYSIRSQGVDAARELAGWSQHVNLADKDCFWGTVSVTPEYTRSFQSNKIAECLFGSTVACNNDCNEASIVVSGSRVANRGANDWLADYFYLPTDFQSTLNFSPRIQNAIVDIDFYLGLDAWVDGLFFRLDLPINWTSWNLNMCENITSTGVNNYDAGYFNSWDVAPTIVGNEGIGVERSKLLGSFGAFACGNAPTGVVNGQLPTGSTPSTFDPLCNAKICCGARTLTALADLQMILGWNFLLCEDYHLGVGLLARAPTGNRPTGEYLFEPVSGNGGHWELGGQITSHVTMWRCEETDRSFGFYLDANITHLFNAKQRRTFDLNCKPLSRYMLAEKFGTPVVNLAGGITSDVDGGTGTNIPSAQFANEFSPVANLTTQEVKVSVGVQGDLAAQFTYVSGNWNFDIGYNFWGRSKEKISCQTSSCSTSTLCSPCNSVASCNTTCNTSCNTACANVAFAPNTWGLKGDAYVYGFEAVALPGLMIRAPGDSRNPVALSATEQCATINHGTNFPATGVASSAAAWATDNSGVDNAQFAFTSDTGVAPYDLTLNADPSGLHGQTRTSVDPVFIACADFNKIGTSALSNKIYTHLSYNWSECDTWNPYVGIGAYGEWGSNSSSCNTNCSTTCPITPTTTTTTTACSTNCSSPCGGDSMRCSLSQWGVWAKFGVSYN